jgi:SAM-dependent methyltransferase
MDLLELGFRTLDEWSVFFRTMRPGIESQRAQALDRIAIEGLHDPYLGLVTPERIELDSARLRESLIAHSCTSRTRAILHVLRTYACGREKSLRVFASERLSPFAQRLRSIFPRFTGSEYLPLASDRRAHPRVMHQDVQALSFSDDSFDIYVSCEVLEHVPDMDRAISEAARILKPGGLFVGTVPFNMRGTERTIKARLGPDGLEHLAPPEYHGNPTRPDEGSLVFAIPGWDFVQDLERAGFEDAGMRFVMSGYFGLLTNDVGGVFLFAARKPVKPAA